MRITCADSTTVALRAPFAWTPRPALLTSFTTAAREPRRAAVLLVRRGRWAVGVFDGADLVVSKVDARQVQGRTAAGGWSQQRFARRRGHQTDAVVEHAVETAVRVLLPHRRDVVALFTGGDRGLVDEVLADRRLAPLAALRREPHARRRRADQGRAAGDAAAVPRGRRPHRRTRRPPLTDFLYRKSGARRTSVQKVR